MKKALIALSGMVARISVQQRQFLSARRAPGRPEVEHHHLPAQIGRPHMAAVRQDEVEGWRQLPFARPVRMGADGQQRQGGQRRAPADPARHAAPG